MQVEVWADFHCPYCYLGIERLKRAIEERQMEDVQIVLRSYLLNPDIGPEEDSLIEEYVAKTYDTPIERVRRTNALLERKGKALNLSMNLGIARFTGMLPAHRVLQYMKTLGLGQPFFERAQKALFEEGELMSDTDLLIRLASELGAEREKVRGVLESEMFTEEVFSEYHTATDMEIDFVPYYIFEGGEVMSGERTYEEYLAALDRMAEQ